MDLSKPMDKPFPINALPSTLTPDFEYFIEHLFFSSAGYAILLDRMTPVFAQFIINQDTKKPELCITAQKKEPYDSSIKEKDYTDIKLTFYAGKDIRVVYDDVVNEFKNIPKPGDIPDKEIFPTPMWMAIPGN